MKQKKIHRMLGLMLAGALAASNTIQPMAGEENRSKGAVKTEEAADTRTVTGREGRDGDQDTEPAAEAKTVADTEAGSAPDTGAKAESSRDTGSGSSAPSGADADGGNGAPSGADTGSGRGTEAGAGTETETSPESGGENGEDTESGAGTEAESGAQPGAGTEAEGGAQPGVGTEAGNGAASGAAMESGNDTEAGAGTGSGSGAPSGADTGSESGSESGMEEGETDAEPGTESETETDTGARESSHGNVQLSVFDTDGTACPVTWLQPPASVDCQGRELPVDYADGVCLVKAPEGTEQLDISIKGLEESGEDGDSPELFFARWDGYFTETEGKWRLYPDFLDGDTAVYAGEQMQREGVTVYEAGYEDGAYTLPLEKFMWQEESFTLEQQAVYGKDGSEASYAEICVGMFGGDGARQEKLLILVQLGEAKDQTDGGNDESMEENGGQAKEQTEQESPGAASLTETELAEDELADSAALYASAADIEKTYKAAGKNLADSAKKYTPQVASMNGEWQILGLARSGQEVDPSVYALYKGNVVNTLKEKNGVLHDKKYTEYSRVILALTALGEDVTNVGGYNLLEPLADYDQTVWQGVNGAAFALIAFDSHDYEIPTAPAGKTQNSREKLIENILFYELSGGGWNMSGAGAADPDVTAMMIQALAPYYGTNQNVKTAVDNGLAKLSSLQNSSGGFASYGDDNCESCAQVIVALTAMGINPQTDARFIKNGKTVLDGMLRFAKSDGSFEHKKGAGSDQMATEQAYYALTAYQRFLNGENSLYDMTDVLIKSDQEKIAEAEALIDRIPSTVTLKDAQTVKAALAYYNGLNKAQKAAVNADKVKRLQQAAAELEKLEAASGKNTDSGKSSGTKKNPASNKNKTSGDTKSPGGSTKSVSLVSGKSSGGSGVYGGTAGASAAKDAKVKKTGGTSGKTEKEDEEEEEAAEVIRKMNLLFLNTWKRKQLPNDASEYTQDQLNAVIEVYQGYEALDDNGKALVEAAKRYPDYQEALQNLGEVNHYDEATGVDMRENREETLPWYVSLSVDPELLTEEEEQEIRDILGQDSELYGLNDIHLESILTGEEWEPESVVKVRLPMADLGDCDSAVVLHVADDGSVELLEGRVSGQELVFEAAEFSRYGIAGIRGTLDELMEKQEGQDRFWFWLIPGAGAAVLLILLVIVRVSGTRRKKGVKDSGR